MKAGEKWKKKRDTTKVIELIKNIGSDRWHVIKYVIGVRPFAAILSGEDIFENYFKYKDADS